MNETGIWRIVGSVKNYKWGKLGKSSMVAKLANLNSVEDDEYYAELWFGTHFSGSTQIIDNFMNYSLNEWLFKNNKVYGSTLDSKCRINHLKFLFKVLSINIPLSIQLHPDKKMAEHMNRTIPELYKDDNHKPELVIAITPLKLMCSFRPLHEISKFIECIPQIAEIVGKEECENFLRDFRVGRGSIKQIFRKLLTSESEAYMNQIKSFNFMEYKDQFSISKCQFDILKKYFKQISDAFPNDIGSFCIFFLNVVELQPNQALFIEPNEPHAYISGDCVECMANSDNVVRACLTSKHRDINNFLDILSYNHKDLSVIDGVYGDGVTFSVKEKIYAPLVKEFQLGVFNITERMELPVIPVLFLILVTSGSGLIQTNLIVEEVKPGSSFFVAAGVSFVIVPNGALTVYRIFTPF